MRGFSQKWLHNIYELNTAHKIGILARNVLYENLWITEYIYDHSSCINGENLEQILMQLSQYLYMYQLMPRYRVSK